MATGGRWIITFADGAATTNEYYLTGELKWTSGSRTVPVGYQYDSQGRMQYMTNWASHLATGARVTQWKYDAYRGFMTNKIDALSQGVYYQYGADGQMTNRMWARSTPRISTRYGYNKAGELETVSYSDNTPGVAFGYDRQGRRTTVTRNNLTTALVRNEAGQLLGEAYSGTGILAGLAVEELKDSVLRPYQINAKNGATTLSTYSLGYNTTSGRLQTVTSGSFGATYSYVANSLLVGQIGFTNNGVTAMTMVKQYDKLNRLMSMDAMPANTAQMPLSYGSQYNDANQRTRVTLQDGSYWVYQYDSLGQVTSGKKYFADNTPVPGQQFEYAHDDIGNRTSTKAGGDQYGQGLRSASYTPNSVNQYTSRTVPGGFDVVGVANNAATVKVDGNDVQYRRGEYWRQYVSVDNTGMPVWRSVSVTTTGGGSATGSVFIPKTAEAFGYDFDGNLTSDGRWTYVWDGENRLTQMTANTTVGPRYQIDFEYDWQGRRIRKTVTNLATSTIILDTKFLYNEWNLLVELNGANNAVLRSYVWGSDLSGSLHGAGGVGGLLKVKDAANGTHFAAYDLNGNVMGLVNAANGIISAQYEYGP